jgi:hypothetical protein
MEGFLGHGWEALLGPVGVLLVLVPVLDFDSSPFSTVLMADCCQALRSSVTRGSSMVRNGEVLGVNSWRCSTTTLFWVHVLTVELLLNLRLLTLSEGVTVTVEQ